MSGRSIGAIAGELHDEMLRRARLQVDQRELDTRDRIAVELGMIAGINGALLTLVESGILPGAFES